MARTWPSWAGAWEKRGQTGGKGEGTGGESQRAGEGGRRQRLSVSGSAEGSLGDHEHAGRPGVESQGRASSRMQGLLPRGTGELCGDKASAPSPLSMGRMEGACSREENATAGGADRELGRRGISGRCRDGVGRAGVHRASAVLPLIIAAALLAEGVGASGWGTGFDGHSLWEAGWSIYGGGGGDRRQAADKLANAIGSKPRKCGGTGSKADMWCSRCHPNATDLWYNVTSNPSWITFDQIFNDPGAPKDVFPKDGQPITRVNGQNFANNQYHYFELIVKNGDPPYSTTRSDLIYFTLVSPSSIKIANGRVVPNSEYAARAPAWDFFVGQNCIPQEGNWNNQGYGNLNANELVKTVVVNVTRDARYFIALQSRKLRYGVVTFDATMNISRGMLVSQWETTSCTDGLVYRYPDRIASMQADYRATGTIGKTLGGPAPMCGETPRDLKYNVNYVYPTPSPRMSDRDIAIVVGAVCGAVVFLSFAAGAWLFVRYKRTTKRMAKFSSLSRGLPDALMEGEGQEVAV